MSRVLTFLKSITLGIALVAIVAYFGELLVSHSSSLPHTWFLNLKRVAPQKGDLTVFWHEGRGQKMIKQIVGQAGEVVHYDQQGRVLINQQLIGKVFAQDSQGQQLHPLKSQVIPASYVFVSSAHERSFDSRYQEVGLIPANKIQGKVIALW